MLFVVDMYKMDKEELILLECLVRCLEKYGKNYSSAWRSFKENRNLSTNDLFKSINKRWYKFNDELMEIIKSKVDKKYHYYVNIE